MQDRISKLFEYALSNLDIDIRFPTPLIPPCDVYESPANFVLKAELPGMRLEDVILEISGNTVTIVGTRRKSEISEESYHQVERSFGKFIRNFILPCPVDEERVAASLKDGLLIVTIPKSSHPASGAVVNIPVE